MSDTLPTVLNSLYVILFVRYWCRAYHSEFMKQCLAKQKLSDRRESCIVARNSFPNVLLCCEYFSNKYLSSLVAFENMLFTLPFGWLGPARHDICHKHHKQRLCKIISARVKFTLWMCFWNMDLCIILFFGNIQSCNSLTKC